MPRYASIWFPFLLPDYTVRRKPQYRDMPFVIASRQRGRMVVESANRLAVQKGIAPQMVVADCKALFPDLQVLEAAPGKAKKILTSLAEWCIGYTPVAAVDLPDGLLLDTSGCPHLWGGEKPYLEHIKSRLNSYGYSVQLGMADTIGTAWAAARFGPSPVVVKPNRQYDFMKRLPAAALRLDEVLLDRLKKLGLTHVGSFIDMPPASLRRRFGTLLPQRIRQALGQEIEPMCPIKPVAPYREQLCCMEHIVTATGIRIALQQLFENLCLRMKAEGVGLRQAVFKAFRVDGQVQQIEIGTGQPSQNIGHLLKLFEHKIGQFQPDLGFEMFVLEAPKVESVAHEQAAIWDASGQNNRKIAELLDRIVARIGQVNIRRYLPAEHYWPERSAKPATPLWEKPTAKWREDWPRPVHLLAKPEAIEVSAALPDYPPMVFRYKGDVHHIVKSDGPERIEQEWWISDGFYRDYYGVEDENGARYWLFRSGPYQPGAPQWFIHGFFA
ncbi:Nucleotidyltransferase [Flavobacterium longum]|uniref:Y-family DNA polymerase n=1 Tax=Flavobacterium longum TaxID=1299340 RepID=UPI0039E7D63E